MYVVFANYVGNYLDKFNRHCDQRQVIRDSYGAAQTKIKTGSGSKSSNNNNNIIGSDHKSKRVTKTCEKRRSILIV